MLKIVDVHPASGPQGEYVVLENQGLVALSLRGWALCTDAFLEADMARAAAETYIFKEDVPIRPYTRVVLFTGKGDDGWKPTTDSRQAYCAYWGKQDRVWSSSDHVNVLHLAASRRVTRPQTVPFVADRSIPAP